MAIVESRSREEWQELDSSHYLHPFTDYKDLGEKKSRIITRADDVYIYDVDGNRILDGMSGLWCVNAGYGRDELVDAAEKQMRELPYYNSFFQCANPPSIELSRMLQEVELMDQPERQIVIARENAYHGSTIGGTSLGGMKLQRAQGGMLVPGIEHIEQPYWFGSDRSLTPDEFGLQAARALERKIEEMGADKVAAFVAEPIQGAGGVIIPPETYWPEIQRICNDCDLWLRPARRVVRR
jgi:putrescine aminotransferase